MSPLAVILTLASFFPPPTTPQVHHQTQPFDLNRGARFSQLDKGLERCNMRHSLYSLYEFLKITPPAVTYICIGSRRSIISKKINAIFFQYRTECNVRSEVCARRSEDDSDKVTEGCTLINVHEWLHRAPCTGALCTALDARVQRQLGLRARPAEETVQTKLFVYTVNIRHFPYRAMQLTLQSADVVRFHLVCYVDMRAKSASVLCGELRAINSLELRLMCSSVRKHCSEITMAIFDLVHWLQRWQESNQL